MTLSRREFLRRSAIAGSGLVVAGFAPELVRAASGGAADPAFGDGDGGFEPNVLVRVAADGIVTLTIIRHEMGQGARTLLAMILADELEADWEAVRLEQAVTGPKFRNIRLHTSGSWTVRGTWEGLRRAGATAREMLVGAAADRWGVPAGECRAESGTVVHPPSGRKLGYGELADAAARREKPAEPRLKDPSEFRLIGHPVRRVDGPAIVTGALDYGLDVRVPAMLFASIERGPVLGARLVRFDAAAALAQPGVRYVRAVRSGIQEGVAVVATGTWAAMKARRALRIEWDEGPHRDFASSAFEAALPGWLDRADARVRIEGDAPGALDAAAKRHEATYTFPFQAHAPLEVMNCTADVRADAADVWAPTQTQFRSLQQAVKVTGLPEDAIRVRAVPMGGAFGRRLFADYVAEACEISKALARPVQVVWTREDEMRQGYFQPCTGERLTGGLDATGRLVALEHRSTLCDLSIYGIHEGRPLYGPGAQPSPPVDFEEEGSPWGSFDNPYDVPNLRATAIKVPSPVPHGPWRAVEYPSTVWARESFLDEMAALAGRDPLAFRLGLLGGGVREVGRQRIDRGRLARVLERAAARAGWDRPLPQDGRRRGRGLAVNSYDASSYIAQVAEVSLAPDLSDLRVHRITCVADCGLALNPLGLAGQAESGITWGLSYALRGAMAFEKGRAVARGFADYGVLRMGELPELDVEFVPGDDQPGGFGEHAVPMAAPAIGNAVFAATGVRVRRLPITPASIRAAREG